MDSAKIKKEEKEYLHTIENNLKKIYNNQGGNISDISPFGMKKAAWIKKILIAEIIALFVFLSGIAYFWLGDNQESAKNMDVRIEIPEKIAAGEETPITIYYKNKRRYALSDIELIVQYPENFEYLYSEPLSENSFHDIWKLGGLKSNEEGRIHMSGRMVGDIGMVLAMKATVTYRPENINSTFKQEFSSQDSQIASSILSIDISGAEKVIPNQETTHTFHYKNTSINDIANALVRVQFPENFVFISSSPRESVMPMNGVKDDAQKKMKKAWLFMDMKSEEEGDIKVVGRYDQANSQKSQINYQIGILVDKNFIAYQDKKFPFEIINHGLNMAIMVNGSKEDNSVNFSDTLNYTITFKNIGANTLYDLQIAAQLVSQTVSWDTLIDKNKGKRQNNTLQWTSAGVPSLALLPPLGEGSIDFSIRLKNLSEVNIAKDDLKTIAIAEAVIGKIGEMNSETKILSKPIASNINTEMELKVEGRYFDDDNIAVGQGPLPPVAGQKTTFRIYWSLSNNLHSASNVALKTRLSPDVKWEDKFSNTVGTLMYNPSDGSIVWKIPKISPNKSFEELNAWFDISTTPKDSQIGKLVMLIADTTLSAKDDVTSSAISKMSRGLTSNLEDDPIGGGRGLVEKGN